VIRRSSVDDLELVFSIQREASTKGFANVFPPERYPYPDEVVQSELLQTT
jgi:hypothetical protein